jgi:putative inorganic carbon (HCO3(-)) transporter
MSSIPLVARKHTKGAPDGADSRGVPPAIGYDRIHFLVLSVFAIYVLAWFLQLGTRVRVLGELRIELILALSLVGLALVTPRQRPEIGSNLYAYIAWFYLAVIIQIPFSYDFANSWIIFFDRFVKFSFMALFIVVFVRTPFALRLFLAAFLLACLKLGQEGLVGTITGSLIWENQGVMRLNGPTPLYSHPNSFSGMALGTLPFVYYLFPLVNRWLKVALLVLAGLSFNIILHAGSRTTYVGFFLFAAFLLWRSEKRMKFLIVAIAAFAVTLPFIPDQYVERFQSITGQEKEGHSKERRVEILQDAVVIFSEHPFGVGVAAFPAVRIQRFGRFQDTHNLYFEVATNLGVQGFLIWLMLIIAIFKNISRLSLDLKGQLTRLLAGAPEKVADSGVMTHVANVRLMLAVINAVCAYLVIRLILGFFGMDLYEIYWWVVLGLVIAVHNMSQVSGKITNAIVPPVSKHVEGRRISSA